MIGIISTRLEGVRERVHTKLAKWGWLWVDSVDITTPTFWAGISLRVGGLLLSFAYDISVSVTRVRDADRPGSYHLQAWYIGLDDETKRHIQERMQRDRKRLGEG